MSASDLDEIPSVLETELGLPLLHRGKVRDVYEVGDDMLLLVATDRVSAFDVVLDRAVPFKGEVLTLLTSWWLKCLEGQVQHHLVAVDPRAMRDRVPALGREDEEVWARRSMLVRRTDPVPVECVVRGYLAGSAWKEYADTGTLAGEPLPPGLRESQRLHSPVFSPATKAERGEHDENIPFSRVEEELGADLACRLRRHSLGVFRYGSEVAARRGLILADTKFEFGSDADGELLLIDEVMTPDSSRFWPADGYEPGGSQPSFDKQPIRDWLARQDGWDRTPPAPPLTDEVVDAASERYRELFRRLTGMHLRHFNPPLFGEDR